MLGGSTLDVIRTVVDILVVAYIIYKFLELTKGTRTVQMLIVVLGVAMLILLSRQQFLDLPTFRWLVDKSLYAIVLVVVVLYQDDIRRSLVRIRWLDALGKGRGLAPAHVQEEVVKAVRSMAGKRMGALIVIERTGNIEPYSAKSGTRLDSIISKDALYSIFVPGHENPLHDGAALLSKDRILAAGCTLPLTSRADLESWAGMRHRAAVGVSEEVDAVVVVVSEESGRISVAIGGDLQANLKVDELRHLLSRELAEVAPAPAIRSWRDRWFRKAG
jgi:diadenylate cyclase